jgi:ribosome-binding factor A
VSHRPQRIANVVRQVVSDAIANRLSDPRVSSLTSVTRVEMTRDLHFADVFVSVIGESRTAATTMKGLDSARGLIQKLVARRLDIRVCPHLRFHLDVGLKRAADTIDRINQLAGPDESDQDIADNGTFRAGAAAGDDPS